jgi:uncharacterized membrane protein (DUF2068 family)
MDWNLRSCSRKGHVTYAAHEPQYRDKLQATTPLGAAWRCLRCGTFVLGPPASSGPAADAPVLLRGRELRSAFVLRLLAVERWVRGTVIILLGVAVIRFSSTEVDLRSLFERDLAAAKPLFQQIHFNVDDSGIIRAIQDALHARSSTLTLVATFLFGYGGLQLLEGIGLWSLQRWGEYVAVIGTTIFIPLEVYELTEKITWLRITALAVNVAAVLYLLISKRLFGLRGGHAAYLAQQREESLLEVETSADEPAKDPEPASS